VKPQGQDPFKRIPTIRALKHYSNDESNAASATRLRDDVLIRFITPRTSVTLPQPHEGDLVDKPISYVAGPLVLVELRNGAVLEDGSYVFTAHNELLRESVDRLAFIDQLLTSHPDLTTELAAAKPEGGQGTIAILGGQRAANYFHWWIDVLAKCWMLDNSPYRNCRLMTPQLTHDFQDESLRLLGLKTKSLTKPLQRFRRLIFAHGLSPGSTQAIAPQVIEFARWSQGRLGLTAAPRTRRLFLSRRGARKRRIVNEDEILAMLGPDFESVHLEGMSVREQASLFSEASIVVAPHGAGLTNLLFCVPPTPVIELVSEDLPPSTYRQLAGLLGHPYLAVPCQQSTNETLRKPGDRDMSVSAKRVATAVQHLHTAKPFSP
jgi:Glycosyltransferase 61